MVDPNNALLVNGQWVDRNSPTARQWFMEQYGTGSDKRASTSELTQMVKDQAAASGNTNPYITAGSNANPGVTTVLSGSPPTPTSTPQATQQQQSQPVNNNIVKAVEQDNGEVAYMVDNPGSDNDYAGSSRDLSPENRRAVEAYARAHPEQQFARRTADIEAERRAAIRQWEQNGMIGPAPYYAPESAIEEQRNIRPAADPFDEGDRISNEAMDKMNNIGVPLINNQWGGGGQLAVIRPDDMIYPYQGNYVEGDVLFEAITLDASKQGNNVVWNKNRNRFISRNINKATRADDNDISDGVWSPVVATSQFWYHSGVRVDPVIQDAINLNMAAPSKAVAPVATPLDADIGLLPYNPTLSGFKAVNKKPAAVAPNDPVADLFNFYVGWRSGVARKSEENWRIIETANRTTLKSPEVQAAFRDEALANLPVDSVLGLGRGVSIGAGIGKIPGIGSVYNKAGEIIGGSASKVSAGIGQGIEQLGLKPVADIATGSTGKQVLNGLDILSESTFKPNSLLGNDQALLGRTISVQKPKTSVKPRTVDLTGMEFQNIGSTETVLAEDARKLRNPDIFDLYDYPVNEADAMLEWQGFIRDPTGLANKAKPVTTMGNPTNIISRREALSGFKTADTLYVNPKIGQGFNLLDDTISIPKIKSGAAIKTIPASVTIPKSVAVTAAIQITTSRQRNKDPTPIIPIPFIQEPKPYVPDPEPEPFKPVPPVPKPKPYVPDPDPFIPPPSPQPKPYVPDPDPFIPPPFNPGPGGRTPIPTPRIRIPGPAMFSPGKTRRTNRGIYTYKNNPDAILAGIAGPIFDTPKKKSVSNRTPKMLAPNDVFAFAMGKPVKSRKGKKKKRR